MNYQDYDWRRDREYLALFRADSKESSNEGKSWTFQVKGFPKGISMPKLQAPASRLSRLIDPATGCVWTEMCFDDYLFKLKKIEILHPSRTVNIHVIYEIEQ